MAGCAPEATADLSERFETEPYWVIDLMPRQVGTEAATWYFALERRLQRTYADEVYQRFARLLLKLGCYHELRVPRFAGKDPAKGMTPKRLARLVTSLPGEKPHHQQLVIEVPAHGAAFLLQGDDLYFTLHSPTDELLADVRALAASEGLFVWGPRSWQDATEEEGETNAVSASLNAAADAFSTDAAREDQLILVDACDRACGTATKEHAHRAGLLHRAFSVVLWRPGSEEPELLLAQRAPGKYHSAGLWANSCCSHPRAGEETPVAVRRRVREELGCEAVGLRELGSFVYRAPFAGGITEYEYDHVFLATHEGEVRPDPTEASAVRWVPASRVSEELVTRPESFCAWAYQVLSLALQALAHD